MKRTLSFVFLVTLSFLSHAQVGRESSRKYQYVNVRVKAMVLDANPYATVYLVPQGDTTITNFALSGENGQVVLEKVIAGRYQLSAELLGYETFTEAYDIYQAQGTDSLVLKERILLQENKRYIQMAQRDGIISSTQADSLRRITSGSVEKPLQVGIDILFQIRDYIDHEYEEQMMIVNEPFMDGYYFTANRMLPSKLGMPEGYVSPEELAEVRQKLAMDQLAESIARDFEQEKLPAWQEWCIKHIPFFLGSRAWHKGKVIFINGHEFPVPAGDPRDK